MSTRTLTSFRIRNLLIVKIARSPFPHCTPPPPPPTPYVAAEPKLFGHGSYSLTAQHPSGNPMGLCHPIAFYFKSYCCSYVINHYMLAVLIWLPRPQYCYLFTPLGGRRRTSCLPCPNNSVAPHNCFFVLSVCACLTPFGSHLGPCVICTRTPSRTHLPRPHEARKLLSVTDITCCRLIA